MLQDTLLEAGVNYKAGVKRFGGKTAIYEKYLAKFPTDPNYGEMMTALDAQDYEGAFRSAHALKGLSGNLSMDALYVPVCNLVEALRAGQHTDLEPLLAPVRASYLKMLRALAPEQ